MQPRRLVVPTVVLVVLATLLSGCRPSPEDLAAEFEQIPNVASVEVHGSGLDASLEDGISADDATSAIVAVRDLAVERHDRGADVLLTIFVGFEPDDDDDTTWRVYAYGTWSSGAAVSPNFAQQAGFVGQWATWDRIESPIPGTELFDFEVSSSDDQHPQVSIGSGFPSKITQEEDRVLQTELLQLWVDSGGNPDEVTIW